MSTSSYEARPLKQNRRSIADIDAMRAVEGRFHSRWMRRAIGTERVKRRSRQRVAQPAYMSEQKGVLMAWEKRGNTRYYYRSKRVNGKVVKEYVGAGPIVEMLADAEATARQVDDMLRTERKIQQEEERERFESVDTPIRDVEEAAKVLVKAALLAAGYHQHDRGEWRLRRGAS